MDDITKAMNNIIVEEEDERGISIQVDEGNVSTKQEYVYDAKLCLVGQFFTEGVLDFSAMQQTLEALWRPGKGVYIKEIDSNLFFF